MIPQESVSLDELVNPSLTVTLRGKVYPVAPLDGYAQQLSESVTSENAYAVMCKIAARCLGIPFAEVFGTEETIGFSPAEVGRVTDVAMRQITAVEATVPNAGEAGNAKGGEEKEKRPPSPPVSPPTIQLAT